ncbi:MAG TPA: hypothetical protein VJX72_05310 [Candidatus Acidoferrum sp.]|nr:hypothetical protein [Candidatus Acidoferrum sp.]
MFVDRRSGHLLAFAVRLMFGLVALVSASMLFALRASGQEEFDQYKVRLIGYWLFSKPSGNIQGHADSVPVDFQRDLGFSSYSTGGAALDWKFTHKNHFYVVLVPLFSSKQAILTRTITFEGQTFTVGAQVNSKLHAFFISPGYQYDIIRRRRGHLGLGVQMDLFKTNAKITALGSVSGGGSASGSYSASGSLLAPIPVAGPQFRLYLTDSPRVFLEGNLYGMYFFGYGSFVSTAGDLGFTLNKHVCINAGYQLASHLTVNGTQDRLALQLSQKGPSVGMEFSF